MAAAAALFSFLIGCVAAFSAHSALHGRHRAATNVHKTIKNVAGTLKKIRGEHTYVYFFFKKFHKKLDGLLTKVTKKNTKECILKNLNELLE